MKTEGSAIAIGTKDVAPLIAARGSVIESAAELASDAAPVVWATEDGVIATTCA